MNNKLAKLLIIQGVKILNLGFKLNCISYNHKKFWG